MRNIVFIVLALFLLSGVTLVSSCASQSQCKKYAKKQKKQRKSRYQPIDTKTYIYNPSIAK
jgi:hypothetical protein